MRIFQAKIGLFPCKIRFDRRQQENNFKSCTKNLEREIRGKEMSKWSIPPILLKKYPLHAELANFI